MALWVSKSRDEIKGEREEKGGCVHAAGDCVRARIAVVYPAGSKPSRVKTKLST